MSTISPEWDEVCSDGYNGHFYIDTTETEKLNPFYKSPTFMGVQYSVKVPPFFFFFFLPIMRMLFASENWRAQLNSEITINTIISTNPGWRIFLFEYQM